MKIYDIDYFIDKFKYIPDDLWCIEKFTDDRERHCALGHCDIYYKNGLAILGDESEALQKLFMSYDYSVAEVNDDRCVKFRHQFGGKYKNPKERILVALELFKSKNETRI